ncbi:4-coumarate--CoA ligase [Balamuthia mandrillaris]
MQDTATAITFKSQLEPLDFPLATITQFTFQGWQSVRDKAALVDVSGRQYNYGQLYGAIQKVALGLHQHGVRKGDVVCIFAPNLPEYPIAFHAVASLGAIVTGCTPLASTEELAYQLKDSDAKFLITISLFLEKAKAAMQTLETPIQEIFVFGEAEGATPFASLLKAEGEMPNVEIDPKTDTVAIPYSSGTTGLPKGVELTHLNLVTNVCQIEAVLDDIKEDDVFIGVLPFYHIYAMIAILSLGLHKKIKTVIMPKFDLEQYLQIVQEHKVTYAHIVPPIVLALAKSPLVDKYDLSSLRVVFSGAAPLSGDLEKECISRLNVQIKQGYGMTELSPATHITPSREAPAGSVGILLPNLEARIQDPATGEFVGVDQDGEICVRGPNIMKGSFLFITLFGFCVCLFIFFFVDYYYVFITQHHLKQKGYYKRPDATAAIMDKDGFLHTGDIGHVDENGFYFVVDRLKELIKFKGFQVPPAELEGKLLTHPAVADCAVVGKPDDEAGELPKAYVVLKKDHSLTAEELIAWFDDKVSPYKKLRGGLEFVDLIPKNMSGKILRRVLKDKEIAAAKEKVVN